MKEREVAPEKEIEMLTSTDVREDASFAKRRVTRRWTADSPVAMVVEILAETDLDTDDQGQEATAETEAEEITDEETDLTQETADTDQIPATEEIDVEEETPEEDLHPQIEKKDLSTIEKEVAQEAKEVSLKTAEDTLRAPSTALTKTLEPLEAKTEAKAEAKVEAKADLHQDTLETQEAQEARELKARPTLKMAK